MQVRGRTKMICFGNGVDCQVVLSNLAKGSYLSISFGWGIGVSRSSLARRVRGTTLTLLTVVLSLALSPILGD